MKNFIASLMLGAFAFSFLAGCGNGGEATAVCKKYTAALQKGNFAAAAKLSTDKIGAENDRLATELKNYLSSGDSAKQEAAETIRRMYEDYQYDFDYTLAKEWSDDMGKYDPGNKGSDDDHDVKKSEFIVGDRAAVWVLEKDTKTGKVKKYWWVLRKVGSGDWKIYKTTDGYAVYYMKSIDWSNYNAKQRKDAMENWERVKSYYEKVPGKTREEKMWYIFENYSGAIDKFVWDNGGTYNYK